MKVVRYRAGGQTGIGVRDGAGVHPTGYGDLRALLESEAEPLAFLRERLRAPVIAVEALLAPLADRCQIISTGGNYADHLKEVGLAPKEPVFFPKLWSSVLDPGLPLIAPTADTDLDYEAELSFVIGRTARNVPEDRAMEHVFGFTVVNDVSARDIMRREFLQIMLCKSSDGFLPISDEIVTADEIDLDTLELTCTVNGETRQRAPASAMIYKIPALIAFLTRYVTLSPGDLVTTGTPAGSVVGQPGLGYLKPGDVVTVAATGIATVRTVIGAAA